MMGIIALAAMSPASCRLLLGQLAVLSRLSSYTPCVINREAHTHTSHLNTQLTREIVPADATVNWPSQ